MLGLLESHPRLSLVSRANLWLWVNPPVPPTDIVLTPVSTDVGGSWLASLALGHPHTPRFWYHVNVSPHASGKRRRMLATTVSVHSDTLLSWVFLHILYVV
jgi:hypothetical protein